MHLTVVVLNWNNAAVTAACARDVSRWSRIRPRILIVDNASAPEDRQQLRGSCTADRILESRTNLGYAGGNNLGIRAALRGGAREILLLNNDARIREDDVLRLLEGLHARRDTAVLGPALRETGRRTRLYAGGRDIAWHVRTRIPCSAAASGAPQARNVDYVPGTVALIRREAFERTGLLDEAYFFSGEMADFCRRARRSGGGCTVLTAAQAVHEIDECSPLRNTLHVYYALRNRFLYAAKHEPRRRKALTAGWIGIGLAMAVAALLRADGQKARAIAWALRDGTAGRFGNRNGLFC